MFTHFTGEFLLHFGIFQFFSFPHLFSPPDIAFALFCTFMKIIAIILEIFIGRYIRFYCSPAL